MTTFSWIQFAGWYNRLSWWRQLMIYRRTSKMLKQPEKAGEWFQWCHECQAFYPIGETTDDRPCTTCGKTFKDQL
jgi:rRNA maturation endonuclease Nob1